MRKLTSTGFILIALITLSGIGISLYLDLTVNYVNNVTVLDKERIVETNGENIDSYYLVYTDKETFKNKDSFIHSKFNSSDFQRELMIDSTYTLKVSGKRIPFLSMYRNIIKFEKTK